MNLENFHADQVSLFARVRRSSRRDKKRTGVLRLLQPVARLVGPILASEEVEPGGGGQARWVEGANPPPLVLLTATVWNARELGGWLKR